MTPVILYDNRFRDATPTANLTASGYDVRSVCDYRAYTAWLGVGTTAHYITVDCATAKSADAVAVIGHNFYTVGASLKVQASDNGTNWSDISNAIVATSDKAFLATFTTASHRYWRLELTGMSAAPRIGEVFLGVRLTFPDPPTPPFTPYTAEVEANSTIGKTGNLLGSTVRYTRLAIAARFANLTRTWALGAYATFWETHASQFLPFFWAWDLTTFPTHVFFVVAKDPAQFATPVSILATVDSLTLNMVGVKES